MGANQSQAEEFFDEEEEVEVYEDAQGAASHGDGRAVPATANAAGVSVKTKGPRLYRHSGGVGPGSKWVTVDKNARWKFAQLGSEEDEDEEDEEEAWRGRKEEDGGRAQDWYLVVSSKVQARVDEHLQVRFNDDQLRVDFVAMGVWALKLHQAEDYKSFAAQYQDCLFENVHGVPATQANKVKIIGKDFLSWAAGEDGDDSMWDAEESFEEKKPPPVSVKETFRGTPTGKGAQSLTMGALANSYLLHSSGVDVFRNREQGLESEGLSIRLHDAAGSPYVTPKKGMLMRAETSMMLMSPAKTSTPTPSGVQQLDIDTGKIVASWQFHKDGTEISMRDITSDSKSAQLDPGQATFLGLDDNRLCRWDMRDRHGVVQELASPVLTWAEGHQFSRGTNFTCFATTGDGAVAVGSRDGKVRLYGTTSMRQAKTAFPGLGSPVTHIDVTYDGKWVLATCDTYLLVISTVFRDKDGREKTGFQGRMGANIAAPRLLKLNPVDAHAAGPQGGRFQGGQFSWVTESDRQERNIVATVGQYSVIWNFRRVKQSEHECYRQGEGLKTCYCYKVVPRQEAIVDSRFMHDNFLTARSPEAPLVVATPLDVISYNV